MHSMYLAKARTYTPAQVFRIVLLALILVNAFGFSPAGTPTHGVAHPAITSASSSSSQEAVTRFTAPNPVPQEANSSPTYSSTLPMPAVLKGEEEENDHPNTQGQSYQVSQPQDYPSGLYQAYLATRQNEGGNQYEAQSGSEGYSIITTTNPAQQLTAHFTTSKVNIEGLQLELSRVAYTGQPETNLELAQGVAPVAKGNRITYQSAPSLSQWYLNGPLGLEQGFTLEKPVPGSSAQSQSLEFELKLSGLSEASLSAKRDQLYLSLPEGQRLEYGQLYVYDATGKALPTHLELTAPEEGGDYHLTIVVEEVSGASYPLTVDPLFVQSQLLNDTTPGRSDDQFGSSIAMSSDGNTALIGAHQKTIGGNTWQGAAYIFTRPAVGSSYTQSQTLSDTTSGAANDLFGTSVALSSDGNTALVGAYNKTVGGPANQGVAYIFTRSGFGSLYSQSQILSDTISGATKDFFGTSVALSSDGNTALVGAYNKTTGGNTQQGVAYIFTRPAVGSPYSQSQILSDTTSGAAIDYFGLGVALSSDGNTALIGAYGKTLGGNTAQGAAYIFVRSGVGSNYSQSQILSDTTSGAAFDFFGESVGLSSDGNIALIGARGKTVGGHSTQGAAYIFTRPAVGSSYTQSQILSDTTSGATSDNFGWSVTLSSDGNTVLIGANAKTIGGNSLRGAAYIFTRPGVGASYIQSQIFTDTTSTANELFGESVGLSSDGNTALIGAVNKTISGYSSGGAVFSFTRPASGSSYIQSPILSDTTSGAASDYFGQSIALSSDGNTALIGASGKTIGGNTGQGAAYIFTRNGVGSNYSQSQVLSDTITGLANDVFGYSVALSSDGNTALIGAFQKTIGGNAHQGAAYIFTRNGMGSPYIQSQILSDTISGAYYDHFGYSVALSSDGNTALIGANYKTIGGNFNQGAAYIFTRPGVGSNYSQSQILSDTISGAGYDYFALSVTLSSDGNTILIGAPYKTIAGHPFQGAAYIFTRSGIGSNYAQSQILSDTITGASNDFFGYSVALSSDGNTALIGAYQKTIGGNNSQGAAYIFTRSGIGSNYSQFQILNDLISGASSDYFGSTVMLSGDGNTALIGSYNKTLLGNTGQGIAYIFTRNGTGLLYSQSQILSDTISGATYDHFGWSVDLSSDGNIAMIGAPGKTVGGHAGQGAVYSFFRQLQSSSVSLNVNASSLPFSQSLNVTATLTPITATGTVTFKFDNSTLVTQTLASGSSSYLTSTLPVGQHTIVATYSGDSNLAGSNSATVTVTITAQPSAITAVSGSGQSTTISTTFGAPLVAKVTDAGNNPLSSQTVTFTASASGPSGTFAGGSSTYTGTTDASGMVTTSAFTANSVVGTYPVTATVAGVVTPASFQLTNLAGCNPLQVTSTWDNGSCGTLRQAVQAAASSPTKTITINLAAGSVITLTSGLTLTSGVALTTTATCSSGPRITLRGSGLNSGNGLVLTGNNSLYGIWIRGFSRRQIVAPPGSHTQMKCVRATKS